MKTHAISVLKNSKELEVKIPNHIARTIAFRKLSPLAIKTFFYLLAKRQQDVVGHRVSFHLQDLFAHSHPEAARAARGSDYQNLHHALHELRRAYVEVFGSEGKWRTRTVLNILGGWKLREDGAIDVILGPAILKILDDAECARGDFTLLGFDESMKPDDARSLRMLLLAYHLQYLLEPEQRTFSIGYVKRIFGLSGNAYKDWNRASVKLKSYTKKVAERTNMKIHIIPPKKGELVEEVLFTVPHPNPDALRKAPKLKWKS